jgi:virulence-associated protein VapD
MSLSISVRIEPVSAQKYEAQRNHDLRISPPDYIALERSGMNSIPRMPPTLNKIHKINKILKQKAKNKAAKMLQEAEKGSRKYEIAKKAIMAARQGYNELGNVAFIGIITFSIKAQLIINKLSNKDQDIRYMLAAHRVAEELGSKAIYLTSHRDECSPHAHFAITAVGVNGRKLDPKRGDCSRLQDVVAEIYADLGLCRGIYKAQRIRSGENRSKIIHETVAQLHARLPRDLANAQRNVTKSRNNFNKIQNKIISYKNRIEILEQKIVNLINELNDFNSFKNDIILDIEELNLKKIKLNEILEFKLLNYENINNDIIKINLKKKKFEKEYEYLLKKNFDENKEIIKRDIKDEIYELAFKDVVDSVYFKNSEWINFVISIEEKYKINLNNISEIFNGSLLESKMCNACDEITKKRNKNKNNFYGFKM